MIALIDGDTPVFAAALSSEDGELWQATSRLDRMIENIARDSGASEYKIFVSGGTNFRKELDSNYKANRNAEDPKYRADCKLHLIKTYGAIEADGFEADDLCGIYQGENTIICGIDKDLLQIPGKHFSWELTRKGKVVREKCFTEVSEIEGLKFFYKQLLIGDTSDNIKGVYKVGEKKADKIIDPLNDEQEMYETVLELYEGDEERLIRNADLLWIWRDYGITYSIRKEMLC